MEEQRIGHMYWNLFVGRMVKIWDGIFPRGLVRSPLLPLLVVVMLIGIPGLGYFLHRRGQISKLRREIKGEQQETVSGPRPGGADPIVLTRAQSAGSDLPEFRSATLLPGLGMSVLQITAYVPGRGVVSLLAAPSLDEVANGTAEVKSGQNDTQGAFEVPWGGILGGVLSPVGNLRVSWRDRTLEAPAEVLARGFAVGGLLASQPADATQTAASDDGPEATAKFEGTDFGGNWISKTDVNVQVALAAKTMTVMVTVKNVGDLPEPMGVGWHPRFRVLSGDRDHAEVRVPEGAQMEVSDAVKATPTGRLVAASARTAKFQGHGATLGVEGIDDDVVSGKGGSGATGMAAELRDAGSAVGVRLTAESQSIQAMRVTSPSGSNYVSLGAQTNYDDPLGKEWGVGDTAAIVTLQPGQTLAWKVRLDLFPVAAKAR